MTKTIQKKPIVIYLFIIWFYVVNGEVCTCGLSGPTPRIVGGVNSGVNEFPMMAGIVDISDAKIFCGATIISERYCLSAKRCFENRGMILLGVLVGEHDTTIGFETLYTALYFIEQVIQNPVDNIAIIKTRVTIQFNGGVGAVCLPYKFALNSFTNTNVMALGWGITSNGGSMSNILKKVELNVISNDECKTRGMSVTARNICTFTPNKDACQNDQGGPLLYFGYGRYYLIGIIGDGAGCASQYPGVNVRVTNQMVWILANTIGATFCNI